MLRIAFLSFIILSFSNCKKGGTDKPIVSPVTIQSFMVNGEEKGDSANVRLATGELAAIELKVMNDTGSLEYRWALSPQNIVLPENGSLLNWKVLSPGEYVIGVSAKNASGGTQLRFVKISSQAADFMNQLWNSSVEQVKNTEAYYQSKLLESDDESLLYEATTADRDNGHGGDGVRVGENVVYQFAGGALTRGLKVFYHKYSSDGLTGIFDDYAAEKQALSGYTAGEETEEWTNNTYKLLYNDSQEGRAKAVERGYLRLTANFTSERSRVSLTVEGQGKGKEVSFTRNYTPL